MAIREHQVSYRNGPQIMVAGLKLATLGYARGARVSVTDPSGDPSHVPWRFVVANDEHATLVSKNPLAPDWIQPGVAIRIEIERGDTSRIAEPPATAQRAIAQQATSERIDRSRPRGWRESIIPSSEPVPGSTVVEGRTLIIGFDSAWTPTNRGALVGIVRESGGTTRELGAPAPADFNDAARAIREWQATWSPDRTLILLDQPTIVPNGAGYRPVELIVSSVVGRRTGAVQPGNTSRELMFGEMAPVWGFLSQFGGATNPLAPVGTSLVIETFPVLTMIALGWTLPRDRRAARLPKYNPGNRKTFSIKDWQHVCHRLASSLTAYGATTLAEWAQGAGKLESPRKANQDAVDACICLLTGLYLLEQDCTMIGDCASGYMVVPQGSDLVAELHARCRATGRAERDWVRTVRLLALSRA